MKSKPMGRVFQLLLCVFLCMTTAVSLTGMALASGSSGEQNITIRITPPGSIEGGSAAVEICITDNAGAGFQFVQVKTGGGSWRDVTTELEQIENRWYCVEDVTENCTVQVCVTGLDGTVYGKSEYIRCFKTAAGPITPPGGQGTVIDNASVTSGGSEREFFTIATPDENVFYLVIDRKKDAENVYFLNAVTESDLMALAEKDISAPSQSAVPDPVPVCTCKEKCVPGAVNAKCPVCVLSWKDCTGTVTADPVDQKPEPSRNSGGAGTVILVVIAMAAVGGVGWYLKIYKPKKELADAEDFDDLTEEQTVNEDDLPVVGPNTYPEPDEPDYPDGYGDDV